MKSVGAIASTNAIASSFNVDKMSKIPCLYSVAGNDPLMKPPYSKILKRKFIFITFRGVICETEGGLNNDH